MARNAGSHRTNRCGLFCLGPLTFHTQVLGNQVSLSQSGRIAQRTKCTFKNGLVFSSRPVEVKERVRLRVQTQCEAWHGALRVGFTNVSPMARTGPLPSVAIPDLTDTFGHWACPIPDAYCYTGAELEFWVSTGGSMYININNTKYKCVRGLDISRPLWAMIDLYGKTCSILLLGSEKRNMFWRQTSCLEPEHLGELLYSPDTNERNKPTNHVAGEKCHKENLGGEHFIPHQLRKPTPDSPMVKKCVVCMAEDASFTLQCGHQCLCLQCAFRVIQEFGTCPLCRRNI